jgi:hypothetical protein
MHMHMHTHSLTHRHRRRHARTCTGGHAACADTHADTHNVCMPGGAAPLAKVTGVIVTVRVRLRAAGGFKSPPSRPAQRKFCGVEGV